MILDAETLALSPSVELLIGESEKLELPGRLKTELFASVVELNTDICDSVGGAHEALRELRARGRTDCRGERPSHRRGRQPSLQRSRAAADRRRSALQGVRRLRGVSARRQGVSGLHVHIGMATAEACYATLEGILPWLPLVLALSANSPYLAGRATGLASNRAEVLAQLPPRRGAPGVRLLRGLGELRRAPDRSRARRRLHAFLVGRSAPSPLRDARDPNAGPADQPCRHRRAHRAPAGALCVRRRRGRPRAAERGDYAQNRWAALRFGPGAELIHPDGTRLIRVPELARELLDLVAPAAEQLGTTDELVALDPSTCEGERQLEIGGREGLDAVCADLVERTLG